MKMMPHRDDVDDDMTQFLLLLNFSSSFRKYLKQDFLLRLHLMVCYVSFICKFISLFLFIFRNQKEKFYF